MAGGRHVISPLSLPLFYASEMTLADIDNSKNIMIERHLRGRDIIDPAVLKAMELVAREKFVSKKLISRAYDDSPLPIAEAQTISQPYIVALMTQLLKLEKSDKVLEVGTGSGYQSALLAEIAYKVYTLEIIKSLADSAKSLLEKLKYQNISGKHGDGYQGWQEHAPFDKIIVTARADKVPPPLEEQLKEGGLLVLPVGESGNQKLLLGAKEKGHMKYKTITSVRFVPMTGIAQNN